MAPPDPAEDGPDLDVEIVALLAGAPDGFVAARNDRVKALRAAGHKEAAAALAKVRKPSRLVQLVGDLARSDPAAAERAVDAAEILAAASTGDGDIRTAMDGFRAAAEAALASAPAAGQAELGVPLREVLADPDARAAWRAGRLLDLPASDPFGSGLPVASPGRASTTGSKAKAPRPRTKGAATAATGDGADRRSTAAERRAEDRAARQAEVEAAGAAAAEATADHEAAQADRDRLDDRRRTLAAELAEVTDDLESAETTLATATETLDQARRRLRTARQAARRR